MSSEVNDQTFTTLVRLHERKLSWFSVLNKYRKQKMYLSD